MTQKEFQTGMEKLISVFGEKNYQPARVELFWREFGSLPCAVWLTLVDRVVANERFAPMVINLREELTRMREVESAQVKAFHRREAEEFWARTYSDEDISFMVDSIRRRVTGILDDDAESTFKRMLKTTGKN